MFGSIIWEHHKMKKEERELQERMRLLAERTRRIMAGGEMRYALPGVCDAPVAHA
jgi:hypothetical protein